MFFEPNSVFMRPLFSVIQYESYCMTHTQVFFSSDLVTTGWVAILE
jgi:hypothetical protein